MEIINRQASYNYYIDETYETGIVLTGTEIKSIRNGACNLKDSYAIIKNGEIYLLNTHISPYNKEIFLITKKQEPENYFSTKKKS